MRRSRPARYHVQGDCSWPNRVARSALLPPVPSPPMNTWVEPWLVVLSVATAAVWSFAAVELAGRLRLVSDRMVRRRWLAAAAAALGVGVWGTGITALL